MIGFVKETGYDGLGIAPFTLAQYVTDIPAKTRERVSRKAGRARLDILGIHWVLVGPENVHIAHPDPGIRSRASQYLIDLARFCTDVGGKLVIFGSPKARDVDASIAYRCDSN